MNKKLLTTTCVLCILLVLMTAFAATAESLKDWNAKCTSKMKSAATVYRLVQTGDEATATDISDGSHALIAIDNISAGAYIQRGSTLTVSGTKYRSISYYSKNGPANGYVKDSAITTATVQRQINAVSRIYVPEAIANDAQAIAAYATELGGSPDLAIIQASINGAPFYTPAPETKEPNDPDPTETPEPTATPKPVTTVAFHINQPIESTDADAQPSFTQVPVSVVYLGTRTTTIKLDGQVMRIPTSQLVCNQDLNAKKAIGIVKSSSSGRATMHSRANIKSSVVKKVSHGSIVLVIKVGKHYSLIWDNGDVGYILTSTLKMYPLDPGEKAEQPLTGVVSYKDRTTGKTVIDIRQKTNNNSRSLSKVKVGSYIEIFGTPAKSWYEVEVNGVHGFIPQKYVTLDQSNPESV